MIHFRSSLLATSVIALAVSIVPAHAQQARSFVSGLGSDLNAPNCTRTAPCRTFQKAHDSTLPTGEITVLDAGSYGAVIINRAISIINDGVGEAGALVSGGGVGITVNAGANDRVSLRGLTIKGLDPAFGGSNGIKFNSGASLTIENCVIRNQTGDGIQMLGALPANTRVPFTISNTFVADNGSNGILIQPSGTGVLDVVLNRVEMYNNSANGFAVTDSGTAATAVDSVAAHNGLSGFSASHTSLVAKRLVAVYNHGTGLIADQATILLSETMATFNGVDLRCINGGHLASTQDSLFLTTDTLGGCGATGVLVKF
jgi:hypothetical protein